MFVDKFGTTCFDANFVQVTCDFFCFSHKFLCFFSQFINQQHLHTKISNRFFFCFPRLNKKTAKKLYTNWFNSLLFFRGWFCKILCWFLFNYFFFIFCFSLNAFNARVRFNANRRSFVWGISVRTKLYRRQYRLIIFSVELLNVIACDSKATKTPIPAQTQIHTARTSCKSTRTNLWHDNMVKQSIHL